MEIPIIHSNGTSRDELCRQLEEVGNVLHSALYSLSQAAPHGRDYYPRSPDAYSKAAAEHRSRVERLRSVLVEIEALHEAIVD